MIDKDVPCDDKDTILFLVLSALSLLISFLHIWSFKIDIVWAIIILCGFPIVKCALEGLITKFDIKADVLVAIALAASVLICETFAAGEVAFIMTLDALLEEHTFAKARTGIEKLVNLTPTTARVVRDSIENFNTNISSKKLLTMIASAELRSEHHLGKSIVSHHKTTSSSSLEYLQEFELIPGHDVKSVVAGDTIFAGNAELLTLVVLADTLRKDPASMIKMLNSINDAPALKKAYVGVAMGSIGSDIAVADIALVCDDIKSIPHLFSLSQNTMNTIN